MISYNQQRQIILTSRNSFEPINLELILTGLDNLYGNIHKHIFEQVHKYIR